ncbi:abscisic acid receptor PYL2-like protein [Tanacetum coccineum]
MFGYHGVLLVPSFETVGLGPETDYLSPSYDLLNKGPFFTRSWASRNKMARSAILGPRSDIQYLIGDNYLGFKKDEKVYTIVLESYIVDTPVRSTVEDTNMFTDSVVKLNLQKSCLVAVSSLHGNERLHI